MELLGTVPEEQWIISEFIEGKKIMEVGLGEIELIDFTLKLSKILQNLHQNSIIHFDLKPDNILQLSDGSLRLIDFGIALLNGETSQ